ncbi:MAG: ADP-ribosylglycohydrolase family protein, partial [Anaerolineae bacterium]|nr:ADP-ribosylglycohydrolase family protein [Anaerolineae bacterium]
SVIGTVLDVCGTFKARFAQDAGVVQEIERALERTETCQDFRELRAVFDDIYQGKGIPYAAAFANEVVTKGICILRLVKGNLRDAIIAGVNMGRDTDCMTAIAAGISGALSGSAGLPDEWVRQSDYATSVNPYTNSKRTLGEHADGLYEAFKARLRKMQQYVQAMSYD